MDNYFRTFPFKHIYLQKTTDSYPFWNPKSWCIIRIDEGFNIYKVTARNKKVDILLYDEYEHLFINGYTRKDLERLNRNILHMEVRAFCIEIIMSSHYFPSPVVLGNSPYISKFRVNFDDFVSVRRNKKIDEILS